jgi:hypothetical protein
MAGHWGHVEEDAARLAAALERLARLRPAKPMGQVHEGPPGAGQAMGELAHRLDALIAELRGALGKEAAD